MAEQKNERKARERKEPKELRDLKPKKDVKAGVPIGSKSEKPSTNRSGEIDFMNWE